MAADGDYTVVVWADLPNEGRVGTKVTSTLSIGVEKKGTQKSSKLSGLTRPTPVHENPMRTWSAASGATVEASFVKLVSGKVYLKKTNGTVAAIRLKSLSTEDQELAAKLAAQ